MYNYLLNSASITHTLNNMRIITDRPFAHEDKMKRAKESGLYNQYKDMLDYRFYNGFLLHTCLLLSTRFSKPRYKEINDLKRRFKQYIPEGIEGNRFYQKHATSRYDKQYALIRMNTYIGATVIWLAALFKRLIH